MNSQPVIHTEKHFFQAGVGFFQLPDCFVGQFVAAETEPSVENLTVFKTVNTVPVTVTNFVAGQNGQTIKVLGDGQTTVQHGTNIFTNTAANKLLAANLIYTFTQIDGAWYEDAP